MNNYEMLLNLAAKNLVKEWLMTTEKKDIAGLINYECFYTLAIINDILNSHKTTDEDKLRLIREQIVKIISEKKESVRY